MLVELDEYSRLDMVSMQMSVGGLEDHSLMVECRFQLGLGGLRPGWEANDQHSLEQWELGLLMANLKCRSLSMASASAH